MAGSALVPGRKRVSMRAIRARVEKEVPVARIVKPLTRLGRSGVHQVRSFVSQHVADGFFRGLSLAGKLHPQSRPEAHDIEVIRDVPYAGSADLAHRLDVYRPRTRTGPCPVVLYVHGGGFHLLSKETHWLMGLAFAKAGYVVCNISYRLAPRHPFPAALEDACEAFVWLTRHVAEYGGDPSRLTVAGESAGANIAAGLSVAACYERPEPYAQRVFATGIVPRVAVLGCGLLQVTDPERFARRRKIPWYIRSMVLDVSRGYMGSSRELAMADPLVILEAKRAPRRPLPAMFAFVGTKDPVLDDTRRLDAALRQLGVPHECRYYAGEYHAFHALLFRKAARACWASTLDFMERHVREPEPAAR